MKLSISRLDNIVLMNGEAKTVDLSPLLPTNIHAIQWDGDQGEIEYGPKVEGLTQFCQNELITRVDDYQNIIDAWHAVPAPAAPVEVQPSHDEIFQNVFGHTVFVSLVEELADRLGVDAKQLMAAIKTRHRSH